MTFDLCTSTGFSERETPTSAKSLFHLDVHPTSMEELQSECPPNVENEK